MLHSAKFFQLKKLGNPLVIQVVSVSVCWSVFLRKFSCRIPGGLFGCQIVN